MARPPVGRRVSSTVSMIGTTVSHYRILEKLGAGGMGEVYLAQDTKLDRKVALKFLPAAIEADAEARERLIREAKATSKLNHPNILTIHSVEESEGRHFIVMEYVQGATLGEFVRAHEPSLDGILALAVPIAEGLSKAHQGGIVHRDLKPANVLVDEDGRPRILDFGLAKIEGAAKLTQTGSTVGTVAYSSPELTQGKDSDARSDIFSFGVMLYEMIAGRLPFKGEHEAAVVYAIANEEPEPLARYKSDVSEGLQHIISKCLNKDPRERYQSAADLLADLRHELRLSNSSTVHGSGARAAHPRAGRKGLFVGLSLAAVAVVVLLVLRPWNIAVSPTQEAEAGRQMIAVLPFKNLGATDDEYFADGITDEIMTRLANISGLGVISRTSAMKYKDTEKGIHEIGRELGVSHILEGTIRYDRSTNPAQVRISPQLIRVSDDTHLWAETYDRELQRIFAVQSEIAENVAGELQVTLLAAEQAEVDEIPTDNVEAYNHLLRAKYYESMPVDRREYSLQAIRELEKAVEADPEFAVAWAHLGFAYSLMYHNGWDVSEAPIAASRRALDRALELRPDLYIAHVYNAYHYYHKSRDYERALAALDRAEEFNHRGLKPDLYAWIWRRQGKVGEAVELLEKIAVHDPQNRGNLRELAYSYLILRRFDDALKYCERAVALAPGDAYTGLIKATILASQGHLEQAYMTLTEMPGEDQPYLLAGRYTYAGFLGRFDEALAILDSTDDDRFLEEQEWALPVHLLRALALDAAGRSSDARPAFENARALIAARLSQRPADARLYSSLGVAIAGLGKKDEAIAAGVRGTELNPIERDALEGPYRVEDLARIYAMVGEHDRAIEQLERLLSIPSSISVNRLKADPAWAPLRDHPRFQGLLSAGDPVL